MVKTAVDWNYTVEFFSGKLFVGGRGKQVAEGFWQRRVFWSLCKQNTESVLKVFTSARQHANTSYVAWILGLLSYYSLDCCSTIYSKYNKTGPNRRTRLPRVAGWELYDSFIHLSASESNREKLRRLTRKNVSWFKFHESRPKSMRAGGQTIAKVCTRLVLILPSTKTPQHSGTVSLFWCVPGWLVLVRAGFKPTALPPVQFLNK